jgi:hypothetical protein
MDCRKQHQNAAHFSPEPEAAQGLRIVEVTIAETPLRWYS